MQFSSQPEQFHCREAEQAYDCRYEQTTVTWQWHEGAISNLQNFSDNDPTRIPQCEGPDEDCEVGPLWHTVCRLCQFGSCSGCQIGYIYDDVSVLYYDVIRVKGINPARVGFILLGSSWKPVYSNSEALRILAYPSPPLKSPDAQFLESVRSIVGKETGASGFPITTHFMSGKRRYLCRTFVLEPESNRNSKPTIAIVLERQRGVLIDLAARFQLTDREIEAVQHLADGLTSKGIAQRMNVSPATVKVLLRHVMLKMDVSTRSGVIGKLISGEHLGDE